MKRLPYKPGFKWIRYKLSGDDRCVSITYPCGISTTVGQTWEHCVYRDKAGNLRAYVSVRPEWIVRGKHKEPDIETTIAVTCQEGDIASFSCKISEG
jgi:hypothetical protein